MAKQRENMLEAFKASHDQTVRNQRAAEAVEASRRIRAKVLLVEDMPGATGTPEGTEVDPADPTQVVSVSPALPELDVIAPKPAAPEASAATAVALAKASDGTKAPDPKRWGWSRVRASRAKATGQQPVSDAASAEFAQPDREVELVSLPMGWLPFFALQGGLLLAAFGLGWLVAARPQASVAAAETANVAGDLVLGVPLGGLPAGTSGSNPAEDGSPLRGGRSLEGLGEVGFSAPGGGSGLEVQPRAADLAFDDPGNRFTVQVFASTDNDFGRERAWSAFQFLEELGLPVVSPRAQDGSVYLFVGASPKVAGLKAILSQVRTLRDKKGRENPFHDAYVENISRFL